MERRAAGPMGSWVREWALVLHGHREWDRFGAFNTKSKPWFDRQSLSRPAAVDVVEHCALQRGLIHAAFARAAMVATAM